MSDFKRVCPECGSDRVQELLLVWHWANTGEIVHGDEIHLAELYSEIYYCAKCRKTVDNLEEEEDKK